MRRGLDYCVKCIFEEFTTMLYVDLYVIRSVIGKQFQFKKICTYAAVL